jgi:hypothetical protein
MSGVEVRSILTSRVWPDQAAALHATVIRDLQVAGFNVVPEFYVPDIRNGYGGRVDIVCFKNGEAVAIELDRRSPRKKSLEKLARFDGYRIVAVRGVDNVPCPEGIDEVVTMRVRRPSRRELANKRSVKRFAA